MPNISLIVYPVQDLSIAKKLYSQFFGVEPYFDSPYYVGYKVGALEVGLDPHAAIGPIGYTDVDDIEANLRLLLASGAELVQDVIPVGGGLVIAQVKDASGNILGLRHKTT